MLHVWISHVEAAAGGAQLGQAGGVDYDPAQAGRRQAGAGARPAQGAVRRKGHAMEPAGRLGL